MYCTQHQVFTRKRCRPKRHPLPSKPPTSATLPHWHLKHPFDAPNHAPTQATCVSPDLSNKSACFDQAYGKCLGTILVGGIVVFGFSFLPAKVIRRIFPPLVNGVAILLIGLALVKSGTKVSGHTT
jgi:xanthine/uracil permease